MNETRVADWERRGGKYWIRETAQAGGQRSVYPLMPKTLTDIMRCLVWSMTGRGTGISEWKGNVVGNESMAAAAAVWLLISDGSRTEEEHEVEDRLINRQVHQVSSMGEVNSGESTSRRLTLVGGEYGGGSGHLMLP